MKTYIFNPDNYGATFCTMAKTKADAIRIIKSYCNQEDLKRFEEYQNHYKTEEEYLKSSDAHDTESFRWCLKNKKKVLILSEGQVFISCNC